MNKESKMKNVFDDKKYQDFVDKMNHVKFCEYIKQNQGKTLEEISEKWGSENLYCDTLLNIWTKNWNTFYRGGRLVNKNGQYYVLSPRNPQSRKRNPQINFL